MAAYNAASAAAAAEDACSARLFLLVAAVNGTPVREKPEPAAEIFFYWKTKTEKSAEVGREPQMA